MFDLKSDPKLVKHLSVELLPDTPEPPPFNLDTFSEDLRLARPPPTINLANLDVMDSESGVRVDLAFQKSGLTSPFGERLLFQELKRDNYVAAMSKYYINAILFPHKIKIASFCGVRVRKQRKSSGV